MQSRRRWIRGAVSVLATLALLVTVSGLPEQSLSAAPLGLRTQTARRVNEAALAKKLAAGLYGAHSARARYQALLAVMRALHIGVYTPQLKAVVRGGQPGAKDFYLYDFELTILAYALQQKQSEGIGIVASQLGKIGLTPAGKALDPEILRQALISEVRAANAHPTTSTSLVPLLVRALGLRHAQPYDLLRNVPASRLQLDPLQSFLVLADVLEPIVQSTEPRHTADAIPSLQNRIGPLSVAHGPCKNLAEVTEVAPELYLGALLAALAKITGVSVASLTQQVKALLAGDLEKVGTGAQIAGLTLILVDIIHMWLIEFDVRIGQLPYPDSVQATHYGPPGHAPDAGKQLRFTVKVTMARDVNHILVNCGSLVGFQIPPPGPLKDVRVLWVDTEGLQNYGTLETPPLLQSKTDANGELTVTFTPNNEAVPGFGQEVTATGNLWGYPLYQSAFGSIFKVSYLGFFEQFSGQPAIFPWKVSRHVPRGFMFHADVRSWIDEIGEGSEGRDASDGPGKGDANVRWVIDGSVCGEDPYAKPWNVKVDATFDDPGEAVTGTASDIYLWTFAPSQPIQVPDLLGQQYAQGQPFAPGWIDLSLVPGTPPNWTPPLVLHVNNHPTPTVGFSAPDHMLRPDRPTTDVPIQDDPSCPAPQP